MIMCLLYFHTYFSHVQPTCICCLSSVQSMGMFASTYCILRNTNTLFINYLYNSKVKMRCGESTF